MVEDYDEFRPIDELKQPRQPWACHERISYKLCEWRVELLVLLYLQLPSSWRDNVSLSAVVLDERQHGMALRSVVETPTGPMTMRSNSEAIKI